MLNNKLQYAVEFAKFCVNNEIDPQTLAVLIKSIRDRALNIPTNSVRANNKINKLTEMIEGICKQMGWEVYYPGLFPYITKLNTRTGMAAIINLPY